MLATSSPARAITNGEVDTENYYSNVGAVIVPFQPGGGNSPSIFCSGTLIHERVLLTAGHCTARIENWLANGVPLSAFQVSFGVNALDDRTWLDVAEVITHPDYNNYEGQDGTANPRDIGVIILAKPVRKIANALLPQPGLLDLLQETGMLESDPDGGTPLTTVGYGWTLELNPPPGAITIAVPTSVPGSGGKYIRTGLTTFCVIVSPARDSRCLSSQSQPSDPGATPSYSGITLAGSGRGCPQAARTIAKRSVTASSARKFFISLTQRIVNIARRIRQVIRHPTRRFQACLRQDIGFVHLP
jgi:hypothetical protein